MKGKKYISILLLISFSILIGHNLVPHHHHMEQFPCEQTSFPDPHHGAMHHEDQGHQHETDDPPLHCHAFNDIQFVKYSASQVPVPVRVNIDLVSIAPSLEPEKHAYRHSSPRQICLKLPIKEELLRGSRSLRAPPRSV